VAKGNVLVVDDTRLMRRLLRGILESAGYGVVEAESGARAIDALRSESVDLVITDIEMPDMDGLEMIRRIRSHPRTADLPALICTASKEAADVKDAARLGVRGFLTKPVVKDAVLEKVAQALNRPEGRSGSGPAEDAGFLKDCPGLLAVIRKAISSGDDRALERAAHALKGLMKNPAARAAFEAARRLEEMGREKDLTRAQEACTKLEREIESLKSLSR
jgi:two-component system chemotaxis response regulator CheY